MVLKFLNQLLFIYFIYEFLLLNCFVKSQNESLNCFVNLNSNIWKLIYHDEFEGKSLGSDWNVEHETGKCHGNWIRQISCNTKHNVKLVSGFLVLIARHEKYNQNDYTAGMLTSKGVFSEGRYEFRVSQPLGLHIRTTLHTMNPKEKYWHELGQIDMASNIQESIVYRGVHLSNSSDQYSGKDLKLDPIGTDLHEFHLYGVEWNRSVVRFFFDDQYSEPIELTPEKGLTPGMHIRLQIGVGLEFFQQKIPDDFERLQWKCPALIIDYARVYQKVDSGPAENLKPCADQLSNSEDGGGVIQKICDDIMDGMDKGGKNDKKTESNLKKISRSSITTLLVITLLLTFIILVIYLVVQIRKINQKVQNPTDSTTQNNIMYDRTDADTIESYYEIPDYAGNFPEENPDLREFPGNSIEIFKKPKHQPIQPQQHEPISPKPSNEYVPIKN